MRVSPDDVRRAIVCEGCGSTIGSEPVSEHYLERLDELEAGCFSGRKQHE